MLFLVCLIVASCLLCLLFVWFVDLHMLCVIRMCLFDVVLVVFAFVWFVRLLRLFFCVCLGC